MAENVCRPALCASTCLDESFRTLISRLQRPPQALKVLSGHPLDLCTSERSHTESLVS